MRFLLFAFCLLLFSLSFYSCSSDSNTKEKSAAEQRAELLDNIKKEQPKPKSIKAPARTIDELLERIWELPKVQERAEYVQKETKGERKLKLKIQQKPTKEDPYYWIKAGEDNGMNFVSHFQFAIDPTTSEIFYYDELSGEKMPVEEWEKMKENPIE